VAGAVTRRSSGTRRFGADIIPTPTKPIVNTKNQSAEVGSGTRAGNVGSMGPRERLNSCAKTVVKYEKPSARVIASGRPSRIHKGPTVPRGARRSTAPTTPNPAPTARLVTAGVKAGRSAASGGKRVAMAATRTSALAPSKGVMS
jgi:hypothetical protein